MNDCIMALGINGYVYEIPTSLKLEVDDNGIPVKYEESKLPDIRLVATCNYWNTIKLEEHPLRKARIRYNASRVHNITEKTRPTDVTISEAKQMVIDALTNILANKIEAERCFNKYFA